MSFEKTAPEKSEAAGGLFGRIRLFYVGSVQKVVYAHMVKIRPVSYTHLRAHET